MLSASAVRPTVMESAGEDAVRAAIGVNNKPLGRAKMLGQLVCLSLIMCTFIPI
jgi:hypothetical protein